MAHRLALRAAVRAGAALLLAGTAAAGAYAQTRPALNAELNEQVVRLPVDGSLFSLETTIFKPNGPGPFPLAVINHGKGADNVSIVLDRERIRFAMLAHELVKRGYLVAVPMRRGFANSDGLIARPTCDLAEYARHDAADVRAAIAALVRRPDVDGTRILVAGASAGGMAAIAYGGAPQPGVRGIVSFAGGLHLSGDGGSRCWPEAFTRAFAVLGPESRLPQLWVYAENDSLFPPKLVQSGYDAFRRSGGNAELLMLPTVGTDGHAVMEHPDGMARWLPEVLAYLRSRGLPTEPVIAASGFAAVDDVAAFPGPAPCREQYAAYLNQRSPKAFALSPTGRGCSWSARDERAAAKALAGCQRGDPKCKLYAYDDIVVWTR